MEPVNYLFEAPFLLVFAIEFTFLDDVLERAPPLARSIYYTTEAGEEVPAGLYVAVAQVLAYIYQLEQYQRGQVKNAPVMPDIEIPAEFATEGRDE